MAKQSEDHHAASGYRDALRASSIIGGAEGLSYLIGLLRTKAVALLLGPSGVGLIGLYLSYTSLLQTISGLGVAASGVRQVAEVTASGDQKKKANTFTTLRRVCWFTGLLGLVLAVALAAPAQSWSAGEAGSVVDFGLLGVAVLIAAISAGQNALLQGTRRIGDLAKVKIGSVLVATGVAIAAYFLFREMAIVPVLIATAFIQLLFSWYFARRVPVIAIVQPWKETLLRSRELVGLGVSFMWSGLLGAGVTALLSFFVVRWLGIEANGLYGAAWMISGLFAGFILGAMGTDFYPKLTAMQSDHAKMRRLVNEQTEVGILLALPGLLGTLALAPLIIKILYSSKFLPAADLLPWFVLGVFGQVVTWPLGFVLMAKGAKGMYALTETIGHGSRFAICLSLLSVFGLAGMAGAMPITYVVYAALMLPITYGMIGFRWNVAVLKLLAVSALLVGLGFAANRLLSSEVSPVLGAILTVVSAIFCVRGLALRVGHDHRVVRLFKSMPGGRLLVG